MGVLHELRQNLNIDADEYEEIGEIIKNMEDAINSKGILFDDQIKVGFYSHMVSFLRRLKKGELIIDADDGVILEQIEKENMDLSVVLVKPLFEKYKVSYSQSEVVLIAIYIQTASQNE